MSKPKLLLADDSVTIQKVVNLTFADEGIDVITVGDGDSALREIGQAPPDIVLADVHMPGPSGYEICAMMRGIDETANIPVMLLVGSFEQFDAAEADRVGANGHVTKPFQSIRALVDQVKSLIAPPEAEVPEEEEFAPIENGTAPVPDEVDTSDIDSLYNQSMAETVEMPPGMAAEMAAAYAGDGLDDEMIETSYALEQDQEAVEFGVSDQAHEQEYGEISYDLGPEAPDVVSLDEESSDTESSELPAEDLPPVKEMPITPLMQTAQTEEFKNDFQDPFASKAHEFDLDSADLLGLGPAPQPSPTPTESVEQSEPASFEEGGSEQVESTPPAAEPAPAPKVVTLAPEQLDLIVQKVVEKLSEKF